MTAEAPPALERLPDDFMQRPYEILEKYREAGRLHHVIFPHGADVWLVTRYDDIRTLLSDPRVSKDGRRMNELFARHTGVEIVEGESASVGFDDDLSYHMLNTDPPSHTRLRGLVSKAFTLRRMEAFRPRIEEITDELLDTFEGREDVDLVSEYAAPLPIIVICDLLGIPFSDRDSFRRWAVELVGAGQDPEVVEQASKNVLEYGRASIAAKRANPGDDMISALLHGNDDDQLTDDEIVTMIFLFTVAGHITSQHTLSNGIYSLLTHPDQLAHLRADMSIMPRAIDELMRYDGGVGVATFRFTAEEIDLGDGFVIPAGQILALSIQSAHRDDTRYPDASTLNLDRHPLGVLGFGHGTHFCIGQPLAKIQTEVGLTRLLTRFPDLRLTEDPMKLRWEDSTLLRGLLTLPVAVTPLKKDLHPLA
jgi:cytochrome P450